MRYHKITYPDVNNGLGCRVTLWVSGCTHHCKGCHNPETWDFDTGIEFTEESYNALKEILNDKHIKGLTLSGGDPLAPKNYDDVLELTKRVKAEFPNKDIWLYTGYIFEEISELEILDYLDAIIDGPFILGERDTSLPFRGSKNQRMMMKIDTTGEWKESILYQPFDLFSAVLP